MNLTLLALQNSLPYDEQELLVKVSEGDENAFRHLFNFYRGKLYSYILKITESKETAEDTVHDVFLKIWVQREMLNEIQNFNAYLYRMARNDAYNGLRRSAIKTVMLAEIVRKSDSYNYNAENDLALKEVRQFMQSAINKLTPQQKEVFRMSREEGLKQEEIAQRLNISILTVKKHLTNALNYLKAAINDYYGSQAGIIYLLFYFMN